LTLLVVQQEGYAGCKKLGGGLLAVGGDNWMGALHVI